MLSRCFKEREFGVLAVDHQSNRFVPLAEICSLDLTKDYTWEFLHHLLEHYPIKFIHAAPPCGTASRAREIRLSGRCPQPLRSEAEPEDLSSLTGEDLDRVKAANAIYAGISKLLLKATELHIPWTVENPARSLLWNTSFMVKLSKHAQFYNFAACAWGSKRPTDKTFLSNCPAFCALQAECPGDHEHEPYGRKRDSQGNVVYGTLCENRGHCAAASSVVSCCHPSFRA